MDNRSTHTGPRKSFVAVFVLTALLLSLLGLLLWQLWPAASLSISAAEVVCIQLTRYRGLESSPDAVVRLTDAEEIAAFCALWNNEPIIEIQPYLSVIDTPTVNIPTGEGFRLWVAFELQNGCCARYGVMRNYLCWISPEEAITDRFFFHSGYALLDRIETLIAEGTS